jgi:hypothetical protein
MHAHDTTREGWLGQEREAASALAWCQRGGVGGRPTSISILTRSSGVAAPLPFVQLDRRAFVPSSHLRARFRDLDTRVDRRPGSASLDRSA